MAPGPVTLVLAVSGKVAPRDQVQIRLVDTDVFGKRTPMGEAWLELRVADLLIAGQQVHRFEEKNELFRRISGSNGSTSPYDWEGMLQAVALRIHERGLPASQGELVAEMQEWFVTHSNGNEVPDERSIRRRITPIWRELTKMPVTA